MLPAKRVLATARRTGSAVPTQARQDKGPETCLTAQVWRKSGVLSWALDRDEAQSENGLRQNSLSGPELCHPQAGRNIVGSTAATLWSTVLTTAWSPWSSTASAPAVLRMLPPMRANASAPILMPFASRSSATAERHSGILNDPNRWFQDAKDLIAAFRRIVHVSVETVRIVERLSDPFSQETEDGSKLGGR